MSFVLAPHETPGAGLTRVIQEQVAKLSVECVDAMQDASAFAHKARVRCKRVRAVLRLAKRSTARTRLQRTRALCANADASCIASTHSTDSFATCSWMTRVSPAPGVS